MSANASQPAARHAAPSVSLCPRTAPPSPLPALPAATTRHSVAPAEQRSDPVNAAALAAERVESPIIIVGGPRTGTTLLHHMLAVDPRLRAPKLWELMAPVPPPLTDGWAALGSNVTGQPMAEGRPLAAALARQRERREGEQWKLDQFKQLVRAQRAHARHAPCASTYEQAPRAQPCTRAGAWSRRLSPDGWPGP